MAAPPVGRRARNRAARHDQLLAAATEIVAEQGLEGLTMQALADRVDCAVGTIYTYFSSKSALVAAMMSDAVQTLLAAYHRAARSWDDALERLEVDESVAALARILAFGRLFVAGPHLHPREFEFLQLLIGTPGSFISPDDIDPVLPHAFTMLAEIQVLLDAAVATGALAPASDRPGDDALQRALRWTGGMNGVLLLSHLGHHRDRLPTARVAEGEHLALGLTEDLLLAWGAPRSTLLSAREAVLSMAERGELLPAGAA
jgi:AcrR family transcriptional regulator